MTDADLPGALAMLAAILAAIVVPIVWLARRSGGAPASASAVAERYGLRAQPALHRRMHVYAGEIDRVRMEAVVHASFFDRLPPAPLRYDGTRSLMIRLLLPRLLATPFLVENAVRLDTEHDPSGFGLHQVFRIHTSQPDWLRRLLDAEIARRLNGFQDPQPPRPHVIVGFNEHGAMAWMSDPTPETALAVAEDLIGVQRLLLDRCEFMP